MGKGVPDRWLDYSAIGKRVPGTRFIAFKVPLNQNLNKHVDEELRLGPESVLESVPNLGMIIDLTNTDRYYRPQSFTQNDVLHQKLMIPGKQTPSAALAQKFCRYVKDFLAVNVDNDKLIGVHCTHGVNRTGYLICYFMITMLNKSPLEAIESVAAARGHKIERENYLSSLRRLAKLDAESSEEPSQDTGYTSHYNKRHNWNEQAGGRQQHYQQQHQPEGRYQQRYNQRAHDRSQDDVRQSRWQSNSGGYRDHSRGRPQQEDRFGSSDNGWKQQQQRGRQQYQDRSRDRITDWRRPQQQEQRTSGTYHGDFRSRNSDWKSTRNGHSDDPEWNKPHWNGAQHSNNWRQSHEQARNGD
ncbi:RNA/RNP complex-1-interacting phosphatase homolog [Drosophila subobscura]|uniref:RNA/RNP complex-1-interacting phosphatase homolog n=1 Tax=Drosophila subobscura TaxID=7241 RepID=UPI00155A7DAF|nr:RNA/RNP complex-1-interacting phosphatase homolog [Drosophila subobscura]